MRSKKQITAAIILILVPALILSCILQGTASGGMSLYTSSLLPDSGTTQSKVPDELNFNVRINQNNLAVLIIRIVRFISLLLFLLLILPVSGSPGTGRKGPAFFTEHTARISIMAFFLGGRAPPCLFR